MKKSRRCVFRCRVSANAFQREAAVQFWARLFLLLLVGLSGQLVQAAATNTDADAPYRTDRLLVKPSTIKGTVSVQSSQGYRVLRSFPEIGWQLVAVPPGVKILDAIAKYRASDSLAEPDYLIEGTRNPNDPDFLAGLQWGLHNPKPAGAIDADLDAPEAWEILYAAPKTTVAVIDTGVRYTHEDLAQNIWVNPREIAGNGIDDDGNGVIDDIHGFNAIARSGDPNDDNGHGTHVAGVLGAVGNNGKGITGVAWNVRIMACKFLDANNRGATSDAIECIHYARKNGAQIINASWEVATRSSALQTAISAARDAGVIFVTAAGNEAQNLDLTPRYPACYTLDNIVAVASMTSAGALDGGYSNYGAKTVDLAAPGVGIYSTWALSDSSYRYLSGTSMAAPYVSGVLALMRTFYPEDDYKQSIARLLATVEPSSDLAGKTVSGGFVNLRKALDAPKLDSTPKPARVEALAQPNLDSFRLQLKGEPGKRYLLQGSGDFLNWTTLSTNVIPATGTLILTDASIGISKQRYYRAVTLP